LKLLNHPIKGYEEKSDAKNISVSTAIESWVYLKQQKIIQIFILKITSFYKKGIRKIFVTRFMKEHNTKDLAFFSTEDEIKFGRGISMWDW